MAKNAVSKGSIVTEVLLEEVLELRPRYWVFGLGATFMLVPSLDHRSAEKQSGKRDSVGPVGPSGVKMILTLLTKAIAVKV